MATRSQLRTTIREHLEDLAATGTPLWSDAALNEFLAAAIRAYGARFPHRVTATTDPIAAGATSVALPAGLVAAGIVAVRDARGRDVPRTSHRQGPAPIDASGLKLVEKGRRNGQEVSWKQILNSAPPSP